MSDEQQYATAKKATRQDIFLEEFSRHGNVTYACRSAHINRSTLYRWKEKSDTFLIRYNQAFEEAKDAIRHEVYRRGHDGWLEPQFSAGKRMGDVRKYSDTLLIFHAKMLMPEYREKQQVDVHTNAQPTQADYDAIIKALEPYPEARWALAEAIAGLGKTSKL